MTEILVKPLRLGMKTYAEGLQALLSVYPNLEWVAPELEIAGRAAGIRASHGLATVDSLHAATSLVAGATCLIANDAAFRKVDGLKVLLLDDYT